MRKSKSPVPLIVIVVVILRHNWKTSSSLCRNTVVVVIKVSLQKKMLNVVSLTVMVPVGTRQKMFNVLLNSLGVTFDCGLGLLTLDPVSV